MAPRAAWAAWAAWIDKRGLSEVRNSRDDPNRSRAAYSTRTAYPLGTRIVHRPAARLPRRRRRLRAAEILGSDVPQRKQLIADNLVAASEHLGKIYLGYGVPDTHLVLSNERGPAFLNFIAKVIKACIGKVLFSEECLGHDLSPFCAEIL